jgi:hypothetical protein
VAGADPAPDTDGIALAAQRRVAVLAQICRLNAEAAAEARGARKIMRMRHYSNRWKRIRWKGVSRM